MTSSLKATLALIIILLSYDIYVSASRLPVTVDCGGQTQ